MQNKLFLSTLLVTTIILSTIPIANAAASSTTEEQEIFNQITLAGAGGAGVATFSTTVSLTAGQSYIIISGGNQCGSQAVFLYDNAGTAPQYHTSASAVLQEYVGTTQLLSFTNNTAFSYTVRFTPASTQNYKLASCSNGGSGAFATNWNYPTGITSTTATTNLVGLVGIFTFSGNNVGFVFQAPTIASESGTLSTETSKTPVASKFTWTRLNPGTALYDDASVGTGSYVSLSNGASAQWSDTRQSISPNTVFGTYLSSIKIGLRSGACTGSGTYYASLGTNNNGTWDPTTEIYNFTTTLSATNSGSSTNTEVTFNFETATITSTATTVASFTITNTPGLPPTFNQTLYFRLAGQFNPSSCGGGSLLVLGETTSTYAGGTIFDCRTLTCSDGGKDWEALSIKVYGGNTVQWQLNATSNNVGGAYYTYIAEYEMQTPSIQYGITSSWGGGAISGGELFFLGASAGSPECSFAGTTYGCNMKEYRLGYVTIPLQTTQQLTVTIALAASGRNPIYTGTLTGQPTHLHVGGQLFDNQVIASGDMQIYNLFVEDAYSTTVNVTVLECLENITSQATCPSTGNPVAANYVVTLARRTISGTANATGFFNFTGQDISQTIQGSFAITLSKTSYQTKIYTVTVPLGTSNLTLYIKKATASGPTVTTDIVTIYPNPGTFIVPNPAEFIINKSFPDTVYWAIFKVQPASNLPVIQTQAYPITLTSDTARYPITGPTTGAAGVTNHTGQYYIAVTDANGNPYAVATFVICPTTTTCQSQPPLSSAINLTIKDQIRTQVEIVIQVDEQDNQEQARDKITTAADWSYGTYFGIPRMYWVLFIVGFFAAISSIARWSFGRGSQE